mgnify:CR=1 FL=1
MKKEYRHFLIQESKLRFINFCKVEINNPQLTIVLEKIKKIKNAVTENRTRAKAMATLHSTTKLLQLN